MNRPAISKAFRTTHQNRDQEKLVGTYGAGDAYVAGFSSGLVQVKSVTHCCAAGVYATSDIVQRSGFSFPPEHVDFSVQGGPDEGYAER